MAMSDLSKAGIAFKQGLTIVSRTTIADLEKACAAKLPTEYAEFLEKVNGARVSLQNSDKRFEPSAHISWGGTNCFHAQEEFLKVDYLYDKDTALKVYLHAKNCPLGKNFPIASADHNTCFALSLDEKDYGSVKALRIIDANSHHLISGSIMVFMSLPIAPTLTDFFLGLKAIKRN